MQGAESDVSAQPVARTRAGAPSTRRPSPLPGEAFDRLLAAPPVASEKSPGREPRKATPVQPAPGRSDIRAETRNDTAAAGAPRPLSNQKDGDAGRDGAVVTQSDATTTGATDSQGEDATDASPSPLAPDKEAIAAVGEALDTDPTDTAALASEPASELPQAEPMAEPVTAPVAAPSVPLAIAVGDPDVTQTAAQPLLADSTPTPVVVPKESGAAIPPPTTDTASYSPESAPKRGITGTPEGVLQPAGDGRAEGDAPPSNPSESTESESGSHLKPTATHGEVRHEATLSAHAQRGNASGTAQPVAPPFPPELPVAALASGLTPFAQAALLRPMAPADQSASVPLSGVAVEIAARARDGQRQFDIRLDPPELGRIDVRLSLDKEGSVTSRLIVERPETLDLLRRDAANLERALQSSGLKTDGGLEFSLRDQSPNGRHPSSQQPAPAETARIVLPEDGLPPLDPGPSKYIRLLGLGAGVDIRI